MIQNQKQRISESQRDKIKKIVIFYALDDRDIFAFLVLQKTDALVSERLRLLLESKT
jgi:hypothetical protein